MARIYTAMSSIGYWTGNNVVADRPLSLHIMNKSPSIELLALPQKTISLLSYKALIAEKWTLWSG